MEFDPSALTEFIHAVIGQQESDITLRQMLTRALVVFLVGLLMIRFTTPRLFSRATPIDIIIAVIIGSNLSRTLTGNAPFFDVIAATALLVVLHAVLTRIAMRWRPLANIVKGRPRELVRDGDIDWKQMRACGVGERDLEAALHKAGGRDLEDVRLATMERGGEISVVLRREA